MKKILLFVLLSVAGGLQAMEIEDPNTTIILQHLDMKYAIDETVELCWNNKTEHEKWYELNEIMQEVHTFFDEHLLMKLEMNRAYNKSDIDSLYENATACFLGVMERIQEVVKGVQEIEKEVQEMQHFAASFVDNCTLMQW